MVVSVVVVFVVVFFVVDGFVVVIVIVVVFSLCHILWETVSHIHTMLKLRCISAVIRNLERLSGDPSVEFLQGLNDATLKLLKICSIVYVLPPDPW